MSQDKEHAEYNKTLFSSLVMMLYSSAMQQLGKLVNPATHKAEVDLEGAQMTIDLLVMLQDKTQGNLDDDEKRMLGSMLSTLQMNFVETSQSAPAKDTKKDAAPEEKKPEDPPAEPVQGRKDAKDPKYHKSYGETP
jgi:hypothetical protein